MLFLCSFCAASALASWPSLRNSGSKVIAINTRYIFGSVRPISLTCTRTFHHQSARGSHMIWLRYYLVTLFVLRFAGGDDCVIGVDKVGGLNSSKKYIRIWGNFPLHSTRTHSTRTNLSWFQLDRTAKFPKHRKVLRRTVERPTSAKVPHDKSI